MTLYVAGESGSSTSPCVIVLCFGSTIDPSLYILKDFGITSAKVTFGERNTTVAKIPWIRVGLRLTSPITNDLQVFVVPC